jgi:putative flippase GtrA
MSSRFGPHIEELLSGIRFGKFASVGAVGAVFDTTTFVVLDQFLGVPTGVANAIGIEVAILVMFTVNDNWTFASEGNSDGRSLGGRLLRSHLVRAGGSTLQWTILYLVLVVYAIGFDVSLAGVGLWPIVVKGGAIGIAMFVNYVFESLFTWRVHQ